MNSNDIDSDNDGIVDLIESQPTGTLDSPGGNDSDGDGLDDNFDVNSGNTATSSPVNTDGTDNPDYTDTESANDLDPDALAAYDTNNDGVANTFAAGADADYDGLDDNYDNVSGLNATTNVTNGGQTSATFPNLDDTTTPERDWREIDDFDGDGVADNIDLDDDNDGVPDVEECGSTAFQVGSSTNTSDGTITGNVSLGTTTLGPFTGPDGRGYDVRFTTSIEAGSTNAGDGILASNTVDNFTGFTLNGERLIIEFFLTGTTTPYGLSGFDFRVSDFENNDGFLEDLPLFNYTAINGATVNFGSGNWTGWEGANGIVFGQPSSEVTTNGDGDLITTYVGAGGLQDSKFARLNVPSKVITRIEIAQHNASGSAIFGWFSTTFGTDCDSDNDGISNHLDLDSDNDGIPDIIENGGLDANGDGLVDNATDTDDDGYADTFDSDNGGTALVIVDTDADGIINSSDIDSDGDGIIDLIESQPTGALTTPGGNDSDWVVFDDNSYVISGNTASSIPVNSDCTVNPDYTDTDSDNDLDLDNEEAYDTNNDGTANTLAAGTDTDNDGLDDNYDSVVGPNATTNVTNGGQTATAFPNLDDPATPERDWREIDDYDKDGVADNIDIDDDNDGLLDVDELDCLDELSFAANQAGGFNVTQNGLLGGGLNTVNLTATGAGNMEVLSRNTANTAFQLRERPITAGATFTITFSSAISDLELTFLSVSIPQIGNFSITYQNGTTFTNVQPILSETPISGSTDTDLLATGTSSGTFFIERSNTTSDQASGRITFPDNDNITAVSFEYLGTVSGGNLVLSVTPTGKLIQDTDNDGLPNFLDLDSDNDGIADIVESGGLDADGNGLVDGAFTDTDDDGWSNIFDSDNGGTALSNPDTDGDGLKNNSDIDSDGDGIVDVIESQASGSITVPGGNDADDDGIDDNFDTDLGNSLTATPTNTDGIDNPDYTDTDSDNDLESDAFEGYDTNNNGVANTTAAGTDTDRDGLDDNYDNVVGINASTNVTNGGQTSASFPNLDNPTTSERDWREIEDYDGDGVADNLDLDDDNDGLPDTLELDCLDRIDFASSQAGGTNVTQTGTMSGNQNLVTVTSTGSNGFVHRSRTTSNSEFSIEERPSAAGATFSVTLDTPISEFRLSFRRVSIPQIGNFTVSYQNGTQVTNAVPILVETPISGSTDTDLLAVSSSGGINFFEQANINSGQSSGIITFADNSNITGFSFEYLNNQGGSSLAIGMEILGKLISDSDNDGIPNFQDLDSDNDGIADIVEAGGVDADGNGIVDGVFTDTDDDGWSNTFDSDNGGTALPNPDTDTDGIPNFFDIDSDADGIVDIIESQATGSFTAPSGNDADDDGIDDNFDTDLGNSLTVTPTNTDGTDNPDYLDTDSDNDLDLDAQEGYDTNNDGVANTTAVGTDADNDGLDDAFDNQLGLNATTNVTNNGQTASSFPNLDDPTTSERDWREIDDYDKDGVADKVDIDDDNDGILDSDERDCIDNISFASNQSGGFSTSMNGQMVGANQTANVVITTSGSMFMNNTTTSSTGITVQERPSVIGSALSFTFDQPISDFSLTFDGLNVPTVGDFTLTYEDGSQATNVVPILVTTPLSGTVNTDPLVVGNLSGTNFIARSFATSAQASGQITFGNNNRVVGVSFSYLTNVSGGTLVMRISPVGKLDLDSDGDGIFNQFDLDSDNDGILDIVEAGGVDADGNGQVDGAFVDTDDDGWSNTFDSDNGGTALSMPDTDSDGLFDYSDLDSDGDGIVDLIEAQATTGSPLLPTGNDTDEDGIDDRFDLNCTPCGGVTGSNIVPENTDGMGAPDYQDTDSDDDGESDFIEAYDVDNDGAADTTLTGTDADNDGLDDAFDAVNGVGTANNINNNEDALDFPNNDGGDAERDWREAPCEGASIALVPDNATTIATSTCVQGAWTYYFNPGDPTELLFAIEKQPAVLGGNTNAFEVNVNITTSSNPQITSGVFSRENATIPEATFVMGRYWNLVPTSGSLNGTINIRFFHRTTELSQLGSTANAWNTANAGGTATVSGTRHFIMNNGTFNHLTSDLQTGGIQDAFEITDITTGTEDGVNFTQFNGVPTLTGGGIASTVNRNSVVLPVELLSFQAEKAKAARAVNLIWVTATEINNDFFTIERSATGLAGDWEELAYHDSKALNGNSNRVLHYHLVDAEPLQGLNYYRLRQTDFDGTDEVSEIRAVRLDDDAKAERFLLFPNPTDGDQLVLRIEGLGNIPMEFSIVDAHGRSLKSRSVVVPATVHQIDVLEGQQLASGVYYLVLRYGNKVQYLKFVVG
ncbi:MAG: T9SS type A sorting domain-containing protein [Salibacteraceae bacterium]